MTEQWRAAKQQNEDKQADLQRLLKQEQNLAQQMSVCSQAEVAARMQLSSQQSRLKVLQEMQAHFEGYYPGVKAILKCKEQQKPAGRGILGVLIELIETERRYSLALEAALAGSMQYLVSEDDVAAKRAVGYLKQEKLGRATFLPLTSLVYHQRREISAVLGQPGVIGRAADVVSCAERIRPAVEYLLANILLVDNLDVATKIAREHQQKFKIITLDGDVINPGGSITGGSRQKVAGDLLQKKIQLKELQESVAKLEQEHQYQTKQMQRLQQKSQALQQERTQIEKGLRQLELQLVTQQKDLDHLKQDESDKQQRRQFLLNDLQELEQEQNRLVARRKELAAEVENWQSLSDGSQQELVKLQETIQQKMLFSETARQELDQNRLLLVKKQQENAQLTAEISRLRLEKKDLFQQEATKKEQLIHWQQQLEQIGQHLQENQHILLQLSASILAAEEAYQEANQKVLEHKNQLAEMEQLLRNTQRESSLNQQELHQLELKETRLQTEWENGIQKLTDTFELTYEEGTPYLDQTISRTKLAKNVRELRRQMNELGHINVEAIEEYREVKERHDFLSQQREDLLAAKASLHKVIQEMDNIMKKRFLTAFDQVNEKFDQTFYRLFGGGSAGLVMTMPDDILETGIDMIVQPPGKKLVNYSLLSGGEKSLIGIALVLAIFQVKPSPFCVLDEVDAALDEANVDRFAEYLLGFAQDTQFIVVSHRQGTMEVASNLWGVTMEEDGVSKVVSVKLSEEAS